MRLVLVIGRKLALGMPPAPRTPHAKAMAALHAGLVAVTEAASVPPSASGQEANELWAALEAVEQVMPNGGDDGGVDGVPVDLPGMTAEMRLMTGNLRYLAALLAKTLPLLSGAGEASSVVSKEVRAVLAHYMLKDHWDGLCALNQAWEDASEAVRQREEQFGRAATKTEAKSLARAAHQAALQQKEGAEAEYRAAEKALTDAELSVDACLRKEAFPRELATTYAKGGPAPAPEVTENERERAYNAERAKSSVPPKAKGDAATAAPAAPAAPGAPAAEAAAAAAAAAAIAAAAAEKKQLEDGFTAAIKALPRGKLVSYAIADEAQEQELEATLTTAGTSARALMAPPHGYSEDDLNALAGKASVEQLEAYTTGFTWATLALGS